MSKRRFPITVKRGNVSVKVYRTPSNGCQAFTVAYYFGGRRVRKTFADLAKAELEAETVANRICAGELNVLTLTSEDRTAYVRALEMLKPSGTPQSFTLLRSPRLSSPRPTPNDLPPATSAGLPPTASSQIPPRRRSLR